MWTHLPPRPAAVPNAGAAAAAAIAEAGAPSTDATAALLLSLLALLLLLLEAFFSAFLLDFCLCLSLPLLSLSPRSCCLASAAISGVPAVLESCPFLCALPLYYWWRTKAAPSAHNA